MTSLTRTCPECGRIFDLLDAIDASDWSYGHDCEAVIEPVDDDEGWTNREGMPEFNGSFR